MKTQALIKTTLIESSPKTAIDLTLNQISANGYFVTHISYNGVTRFTPAKNRLLETEYHIFNASLSEPSISVLRLAKLNESITFHIKSASEYPKYLNEVE